MSERIIKHKNLVTYGFYYTDINTFHLEEYVNGKVAYAWNETTRNENQIPAIDIREVLFFKLALSAHQVEMHLVKEEK